MSMAGPRWADESPFLFFLQAWVKLKLARNAMIWNDETKVKTIRLIRGRNNI